jgi:hypothetical protein
MFPFAKWERVMYETVTLSTTGTWRWVARPWYATKSVMLPEPVPIQAMRFPRLKPASDRSTV